jgi:glutamate synthase (NADPH/NADH) small chain
MYGIPNMKLDKQEVVLRRIKLMEKEGIKFICNANVGDNVEPQIFLKEFDATRHLHRRHAAARPAHRGPQAQGRALRDGVPHRQHQGRARRHADASPIHAAGKDVVVIGGGDTGTDCVGTSMRHGCKSLVQIEILPKPPAGTRGRQPLARVAQGLQDGLRPGGGRAKFGADPRIYLTTVKKVRRRGPLLEELGLKCDTRSNVQAEYGKYATSVKGVYAAGDCRRGQSLIVWAINEGRGAAREVDRYLMGRTDLP